MHLNFQNDLSECMKFIEQEREKKCEDEGWKNF